MKRYCQTLELVNDPELIEKYCEIHAHVWPEVIEGQRAVGILDMQIYRFENHVFMICETVDDFDWEKDMARLTTLPRQAEWEAYVAQCQGADPSLPSTGKWHLMKKIF
jgi:L-rhamnose mutarotase